MPNYLKPKHRKQRITETNPLYASKRWRKYREAILMRRGPRCEVCGHVPLFEREIHVDHIKPIADGGEIYDETNLQLLCIQCHGKKTAQERGWGRILKPEQGNSTAASSFFGGRDQDPPGTVF